MSEPFVLARMAEALEPLGPTSSVLEIGCGSGYACAVLARLSSFVLSIERYQKSRRLRLAARLEARLASLNVGIVTWGDGLRLAAR